MKLKIEGGQIQTAGPCEQCQSHMRRGDIAYDLIQSDGYAIADSFCSIRCTEDHLAQIGHLPISREGLKTAETREWV